MIRDDLLTRMMHRDVNAFMEMTETYSWSVYSLIRSKITDKNMVESVFNETMNGFYSGLHEKNCKDPLEALLLMYAEKVCQTTSGTSVEQKTENSGNRKERAASASQTGEKKKGGFLYSLCMFLLIAAIIAVIWVIVGLLMDMNFIPAYDLGYSWFNANILPWF